MRIISNLLVLCFIGIIAQSQSLIAGTFNVRYDNKGDTGNLWVDRAPICANLIRFHQFDIVGTQEGLRNQIDDLQSMLPEYAHYGLGRDDGKAAGEHSSIFYLKEKFIAKDSGDFWLSETPDKPGFGWDARNNRICSWVKLTTRTGNKTFYAFSVHFDHRGVIARKESAKLILQKIKTIAGKTPVVLVGDFNGGHQSEWYNTLNNSDDLKDVYGKAPSPYTNNGSFNSFQSRNPSKEIIDHIFTTSHFKVKRYGILTDTYHGKFPSDHYPVLAELILW
ncbi:MAG: endonuclease/exonuclease/phosphatase family protein [Gemmatimonadaceae bacterium]|nr:endonuclease/exonuclease/phosphatase family protein [Chitinophagaceae bacterium]